MSTRQDLPTMRGTRRPNLTAMAERSGSVEFSLINSNSAR